jgi:hypothetical protein
VPSGSAGAPVEKWLHPDGSVIREEAFAKTTATLGKPGTNGVPSVAVRPCHIYEELVVNTSG